MPIRPMPAHMAWRITELLSSRSGEWLALMTVARPQAITSNVQISNGQSKCEINRRSILSIVLLLSFGFELEVTRQNVMHQRRRHGAAAPVGMLDDGSH